jgi:formylmethanofuran dehydrogenase subunit E-like metal-binding protein
MNKDKKDKSFWIGKHATIEILKDNTKLFFKAVVIEYNDKLITFSDRNGKVFSFNTSLVQQITEVSQ